MSEIIRISSEDDVTYVTLRRDSSLEKKLHNFLSDCGINRDKRKGLFKDFKTLHRGGDENNWVGTLQVVKNENIHVEIFTGNDTTILAIRGQNTGEMLLQHFAMQH